MSNKGKIVILSGPSGSGKTTLHKALLAEVTLKGRLVKSISATTRPRRAGERHGRDYLFLTPAMFASRIKKGYFLEWEKVFGHYYGTPKRQVLELLDKGVNVLLCIDVKGAKTVYEEFPQALKVFIKAPSMRVLAQRLKMRASEDHQSLKTRLAVARAEIREAKYYDATVINTDLKKALLRLKKIIGQGLGLALT